jgi:hypothetical protein
MGWNRERGRRGFGDEGQRCKASPELAGISDVGGGGGKWGEGGGAGVGVGRGGVVLWDGCGLTLKCSTFHLPRVGSHFCRNTARPKFGLAREPKSYGMVRAFVFRDVFRR